MRSACIYQKKQKTKKTRGWDKNKGGGKNKEGKNSRAKWPDAKTDLVWTSKKTVSKNAKVWDGEGVVLVKENSSFPEEIGWRQLVAPGVPGALWNIQVEWSIGSW